MLRILICITLILSWLSAANAEWNYKKKTSALSDNVSASALNSQDYFGLDLQCKSAYSTYLMSHYFTAPSFDHDALNDLSHDRVFLKWRVDDLPRDGAFGELKRIDNELFALTAAVSKEQFQEILQSQKEIAVGLQTQNAEIFYEFSYTPPPSSITERLKTDCKLQ